MKKTLAVLGIIALAMTLPGVVAPAQASDFLFGAAIRIGGFHLSIGLDHDHHRYVYRTRDRIHYDHYRCNDRCSMRGGYTYHDERCPVVSHLLHIQQIHPHDLYVDYAPRYDGRFRNYDPYHYDRVNYVGDRYYGDDRYDRYDRGRHDRYERPRARHPHRYDRGRGRGHDRGHGHYHGRVFCSVRH